MYTSSDLQLAGSGRGAVPRVEAVERARAEGRELVDLFLLACVRLWSRCAGSRSWGPARVAETKSRGSLGSRRWITRRDIRCCHVSRGAGGVDCDDVVKLLPIGCHSWSVGALELLSNALILPLERVVSDPSPQPVVSVLVPSLDLRDAVRRDNDDSAPDHHQEGGGA